MPRSRETVPSENAAEPVVRRVAGRPVRRRHAAVYRVEGEGYHAWFARPSGTRSLTNPLRTLPAFVEAQAVLSGQDRELARRPTRIPPAAFVPIGARLLPAPARLISLPPPPAAANSNDGLDGEAPAARSGRLPRLAREALFLAILIASLAMAFYGGSLHAANTIITVPGPLNHGSVVT